MQTALLSAGIAIILALLTALVGPFFVDWDGYRTEFETRVAKLTGLEVRVTGPIDLRILPTPTLTLRQIELGRPGDPAKTRAQALRIEFALGDLLRGEWRAPDLKLQGPELSLGLDASGRLAWSAPTIGLDPDAVSIDHIEIANGRAIFADAGSGARLVLEDLQFAGQVRSLVGPVKGEGSFNVDGRHYPFRLSVARPSDDGGVKVRLNLDPVDYPRAVDVDGSIWVERGIPRFEGTMQVVRAVGRGPDGIVEPWRFTSRVNANGTGVVLQQVELQYGPEERAIRLKGDAKLTFGAAPELVAALSAPQLDLDRILALPEAEERRPLVAVRSLVESIVRAQHLPVPVKLAISADTVTLAGAMLQRVGGDLKFDGDNWDIEKLTFRAPGLSQVALSGRLDATPGGIVFRGATRIDSTDPRALAGWLTDRGSSPATPTGALHVTGDIALGGGKIVLDRLQADLDRTKIEGRLDYAWPSGDQPAKLNTTLHASELDLDRAQSLALAGLGDVQWPREGSLAIDIGRATLSGVEATDVAIKMRRDAGVLDIERLAVGDIGGARLSVGGRIDTNDPARGGLTLDLDARGLDGLTALIEKLSPAIADRIRRSAGRAAPVKLHTSFTLERTGSTGAPSVAKLRLQGSAGTFRLSMQGDADGARVASIDPAQMGATKVHLVGSIDAGDGGALVELLGLDRLVTVSERSGRLTLDLNGPIEGDMAVKSELAAGGLNVTARGTFNPSGSGPPTAELALSAAAADLVALRPALVRRTTQPPWSEMTARLTVADNTLRFTDLKGALAGVGIDGEVGIGMDAPMRMNGNIAIASLDLPATIGAAVGFPHQNGNRDSLWSADPFEAGALGAISGRIAIKAGQVALASKLSARDVHAVVDLHDSELTVADIEGSLAGGRVAGDFAFKRGDEGMATHSHFKLADVEAAELLGGGVRPPVSGKLSAELELAGSGRSPIALIGSLKGEGKLTLRDGSVARFDPGAFDAVTRAVDQGLPIDTTRIGERMEAALSVGGLPIVLAQGSIDASLGQLRLVDLSVQAKGAEFAPAGSIDLTQGAIDVRLVLSALKASDAKTGGPPDISVTLTGPLDMPKRTLEVAALGNWVARRAADQKAKRVDALEQAARENPIEGAGSPAEPAEHEPVDTPAGTTPPPRRLVRPNPTTAPIANPLTSSVAPAGSRSRAGPDVPAPSSGVDGAKPGDEQPPRPRRPAAAEQTAPLAPPLDIRPTSRAPRGENAPRPDNGAKGEGGPHSLQPLRSIFPGLFGP